jgi:hypothetical protein
VTKVKDECERIARGFISELKWSFPKHQVIVTLSVVDS